MFFQDNDSEGKSLKGAYEEFKNTLKGLSTDLLAFDTQARKVVGDTFGQGAMYADKVKDTLALSVKATANLGYTTSQYATLLSNIGTSLQTNVDLTSEQLTNFKLFADAASISEEDVSKLVAGFRDIGVSVGGALTEMEGLAKTARGYGVNVSQYMGVMAENLKLMNQFKFQNGVEGLANMVAKSQALRININTVTSLAEKFLDPEGAISAAASLQMMGGELAKLGDGFQLMNLAQNDVEGLFDALVEATAASASFNEETGDYEFSALEMRRLRGTAKELGVDFNELAKGATNFKARADKLSQLDFMPNIKEEDREFLASIGQLNKGGELQFNVDNQLMSIEELNKLDPEKQADAIDSLKKLQIEQNKTSDDIAREQRDFLQKLYDEGGAIKKAITAEGAFEDGGALDKLQTGMVDLGDTFMKSAEAVLDSDLLTSITQTAVDGLISAADGMSFTVSSLTTTINDWLSSINTSNIFEVGDDLVSMPGYGGRVLSGPEGSIALNDDDTIIAGTNLFPNEQRRRNTSQLMGNLPKEFANVLQNNIGPSEPPNISFEDLQITHSGTIRLEGDGRFLTLDMLANNPQMLENLTNMIKQRMSSQSMGYSNA